MAKAPELTFDQKITFHKQRAIFLAENIKTICETGRQIDIDPNSLSLFRGMGRVLDDSYKQFMDEWSTIQLLYISKDQELEFPSKQESAMLKSTTGFYYEAGGILATLIATQNVDSNPTVSNQDSMIGLAHSLSTRSRLPQITLPKFSGKLKDWPLFKDTFVSMVHEETSLTAIEKYHFLIANLHDTALSIIKHIPLDESGYEQAWAALLKHYDNKRRLASYYINQILSFKPRIGKPNAASFNEFLQIIGENITAFEKLKIPNATKYILFELAFRCLDAKTKESFELHTSNEFPTCDDLVVYIRNRVHALEIAENSDKDANVLINKSFSINRNKTFIKPSTSFFTKTISSPTIADNQKISRPPKCFLCQQIHKLTDCPTYVRATPQERFNLLKNWVGCRNCLFPGHRTKECSSRWKCRQCGSRHHTTLHLQHNTSIQSTNQTPSQSNPTKQNEPSVSTFAGISANQSYEVLLGTALAHMCDINGQYHPIRLVIDSGSQHSFITESCSSKLKLVSKSFNKTISGITQSTFLRPDKIAMCQLRPTNSQSPELRTEAIVVPTITPQLPQRKLPSSIWEEYIHLNLADPNFWKPGPIDFLLGADLFLEILNQSAPLTEINIHHTHPKILNTIFGQVIIGKCNEDFISTVASSFFINVDDINTTLQRFWEVENVHSDLPTSSPEDQYCEEHFKSTHYRQSDGRYVVALPFRDAPFQLGPSYQLALNRLCNLESKLERDSILSQQYHSFLKEYFDLGHMVKPTKPAKFVIPHHGVHKVVNGESKLRVVFDGSSKTVFGSLNDHLLVGPKLQKNISDIILNFRKHRFVVTADIVKMYRQILICEEDRSYQHILWRFEKDQPIEKFELTTVTYGLKASPFLALRVIQQLVSDEGKDFPLAAHALTQDIYVDDIVTGASTIQEILSLKEQLIALLAKGCFQLSKWTSNCPDILKNIPDHSNLQPITFSEGEDSSVKILGLQWDPVIDVFSYNIQVPSLPPTKRMLLSTIARIYDPLGYLSPSVFYAKILLQETWKLGINWDDNLPNSILQHWRDYLHDIPNFKQIQIPRFLKLDDTHQQRSIIGFCDASEQGYCAVLYLVITLGNEKRVFLLKAKSKLAPIKAMTIPRLELCGALLLAILYSSVSNYIKTIQIESTWLFTDSSTVLSWLRTSSHMLKSFVAHRIVRITEMTDISCWRYVPSNDNPADCGSRGLLPSQLLNHHLWWTGPSWIIKPEESWPSLHFDPPQIVPEELTEIKSSIITMSATSYASDFVLWTERFSKYRRLINTLSYIYRFLPKSRFPNQIRPNGPITASEFEAANCNCIKLLQQHYYPEAFNDRLKSTPLLLSLNVFIDRLGLLRVGGRLRHSSLPNQSKFPILLPKRSHFTSVLVDYFHLAHAHAGPATTLAAIQQQYWIPAGRSLVKHRKLKCIICYKLTKSNHIPRMGDLPPERFSSVRAFFHTGVDFAGPFLCKETSRRKSPQIKVYLCLFVCLSTKAVHLELAQSLHTEAFIDALDRFVARRGKPAKILSDCGRNFVGASNYLADVAAWHDSKSTQEHILDHVSHQHIEWVFNPPHAPHFGGIWEAGVKSTKTLLRKLIGNSTLTIQELNNAFIKVEAILNSRPIQPLSNDPLDLQPLTPGHFLIGAPLTALPEAELDEVPTNQLNRWQYVRERIQNFWNRWQKQYLQTLQQRTKWITSSTNVKIGDMVLVKDMHTSPLQWPLARVVSVHPGSDHVVRVVTVKTSQGIYKRPVTKLVPLPHLAEDRT